MIKVALGDNSQITTLICRTLKVLSQKRGQLAGQDLCGLGQTNESAFSKWGGLA